MKKVERFLMNTVDVLVNAIELLIIDLTYGKNKYRRRGSRIRPIIQKTYNHRTVYIREPTPRVLRTLIETSIYPCVFLNVPTKISPFDPPGHPLGVVEDRLGYAALHRGQVRQQ